MLHTSAGRCVRQFSARPFRRNAMKMILRSASTAVFVLGLVFGIASVGNAQARSQKDVRDAIRSANSNLDNLEYSIKSQMQSGSVSAGELGDIIAGTRELRAAVREFQQNFDRKGETRRDVEGIVDRARRLDRKMRSAGVNSRVLDDWDGVCRQIERIANNYGIIPDWTSNNSQPSTDNNDMYAAGNVVDMGLTGTYDLDPQRSEQIDNILADTNVAQAQRDELRQKLEAPGQIAIAVRGTDVTLATSASSPMTFSADGREQTGQDASGRSIRTRSTLSGDVLTISSLGGESDYTITFTSEDNGQTLKVSRRITTEYLDQTIFAESVYRKTDQIARLGIDNGYAGGSSDNNNGSYSDSDQPDNGNYGSVPTPSRPRVGKFIVPNGVIISGSLDNDVDTKVSQNNDRFRMIVESPDEFRGAVVEGYLTGIARSGRVSGRSNLTFNFERITLRDGTAYDFGGTLQSIRDTQGKNIKIDTEGAARGDSQTKESVKRGGIGAGLGAIIGAIIGGGKGAAIGAVIGGGAGAGSVAVQGRDDLRLLKGSTVTVVSSSPIRGPR